MAHSRNNRDSPLEHIPSSPSSDGIEIIDYVPPSAPAPPTGTEPIDLTDEPIRSPRPPEELARVREGLQFFDNNELEITSEVPPHIRSGSILLRNIGARNRHSDSRPVGQPLSLDQQLGITTGLGSSIDTRRLLDSIVGMFNWNDIAPVDRSRPSFYHPYSSRFPRVERRSNNTTPANRAHRYHRREDSDDDDGDDDDDDDDYDEADPYAPFRNLNSDLNDVDEMVNFIGDGEITDETVIRLRALLDPNARPEDIDPHLQNQPPPPPPKELKLTLAQQRTQSRLEFTRAIPTRDNDPDENAEMSMESEEPPLQAMLCPRCMQPPTDIYATTCGHIYCTDCVDSLNPSFLCVTCKARNQRSKLIRLYF
ncbi:hypothetical protein H4R33_004277 [Dimargaris cristalligena]|uniref:RING-type domain-containing protein n=1 Tax=Dimargaris cristalligena TaxID=215637 RepID=A0A4Q0A2J6_9FUNG|nr:hypothetical protein H4R33_004277 [Dimargaris cristalligena]RKP40287.1 hypothetical protein BJ085DRAFT_29788 [Dimargaris cristalligena]|eukprot:RKP40287.1 hypothetical protein BJ085DRAFT_29788 [Dimargaris cristalligena]